MRSLERERIALSLVLCAVTLGASGACSSGAQEGGAPACTATGSFAASAGTGGADGATAGATTTGTSTASITGGPPVILSFASDVQAMTQGDQVTFTAAVTDPDGAGDIAFGDLVDEGTGIVCGAFTAGTQEGAYELVLSWSEINQIAPIDFAHGTSEQRTFVGRFFDHGGQGAARTAAITLECNGGGAACSGICVDGPGGCGPAWSACLPHGTVTNCVDYCASVGATCSGSCTNPYTGMPAGVLTFGNGNCTFYAPGFTLACGGDVYGYKATRCCCGG